MSGYADQQTSTLDPDAIVRKLVAGPLREPDWEDRVLLERFWFDATAQFAPVQMLSGGERRRLQLVMVLGGEAQPAGARRTDERPRPRHVARDSRASSTSGQVRSWSPATIGSSSIERSTTYWRSTIRGDLRRVPGGVQGWLASRASVQSPTPSRSAAVPNPERPPRGDRPEARVGESVHHRPPSPRHRAGDRQGATACRPPPRRSRSSRRPRADGRARCRTRRCAVRARRHSRTAGWSWPSRCPADRPWAPRSSVGTMQRAQIGMCFDRAFPAAAMSEYAQRLESSGIDQLWIIEDCFFTAGISLAATALAVTERLEVGIGILPAVARNPAITAMEIATLCQHRARPVPPRNRPRRAGVDGADGRSDAVAADHARRDDHRGQASARR